MANATTKPVTEATEPKEKTVRVKIDKTKENHADVFVSVNDRTWLIQRGVYVDVPECVAEVLEHQAKMLDYAMAYEEEASKPKVH